MSICKTLGYVTRNAMHDSFAKASGLLLIGSLLCFSHSFAQQNADAESYPSTYKVKQSGVIAIVNANLLIGTGEQINEGSIVFENGRITSVGKDIAIPENSQIIDGSGKWVTPGIIDAHSHLGVFPSPGVSSMRDGNEKTGTNTGHVWAEHSVWPQDPAFNRARRGGVTSLLVLPGSANLIGGRSVTLKNISAVTVQDMKFPNAPYSVKMACGENPKSVYGPSGRTRMGNMAGFRKAFIDAQEYKEKVDKSTNHNDSTDNNASLPKRNLTLETLSGVLAGEIYPQIHCYRADEMVQMIDLSKEFGFKIEAFHHAVEAYKIADLLAKEEVGIATWANRWGFKLEAYDANSANAAILEKSSVHTVLHSDNPNLIQRLNVEAAIAMAAGLEAGLDITKAEAIKWITLNAAKTMKVDDQTGSLEVGKMADIVLWGDDPFSIYTLTDKVYIDGTLMFDRSNPRHLRDSDFELGQIIGEMK